MTWPDREVNFNITIQLVYTHKFSITYNQNFMLKMEYLTTTHHVESCNASHCKTCKTFVSQKSLYIQYLSKFVAGGNKAQVFSWFQQKYCAGTYNNSLVLLILLLCCLNDYRNRVLYTSAIIGWGKYQRIVYFEGMVGKYLVNLNLNNTYILKCSKQFSGWSHRLKEVLYHAFTQV